MRKGTLLLAALLVVSVIATVNAQDEALGATFQVDYVSRYMSYGMDVYEDDDQAIQPSLTVDLWGTGFSVEAWSSMCLESEREDNQEMDYTLAYDTSIMQDDAMQTDVTMNYTYVNYYENTSKLADYQEIGSKFAMPNIIGGGWTPFYRVVHLMPRRGGEQDGLNNTNADHDDLRGWLHIVGMDYLWMTGCSASGEKQPILLGAEAVYNDGWGTEGVDHDWSHANFRIAAPFENIMGGTFTPSLTYQITMDESVNTDDDEFIVGMNYSYKF